MRGGLSWTEEEDEKKEGNIELGDKNATIN